MLHALPQAGRSEDRHARPRRTADDDGADPGEDLAPEKRRHADLGKTEHRVIAGDGRRNGEGGRDDGAQRLAGERLRRRSVRRRG